jgi:hypothetical protein
MIETDEVVLPGILLQMPCQNQFELSRINQTYNLVFAGVQDCAFCVCVCMCDSVSEKCSDKKQAGLLAAQEFIPNYKLNAQQRARVALNWEGTKQAQSCMF